MGRRWGDSRQGRNCRWGVGEQNLNRGSRGSAGPEVRTPQAGWEWNRLDPDPQGTSLPPLNLIHPWFIDCLLGTWPQATRHTARRRQSHFLFFFFFWAITVC